MNRYAIKIQEEDLALITLLNQGVKPIVEDKTYFVFDAEWNSEVSNEIVTEEDLLQENSDAPRVLIYRLK